MRIKTRTEIWLNGKYLFTADSVDIKYNQQMKSPGASTEKTATGTAIDISKKEITSSEKSAQKEALKERDYDVFYKKMVGRVGSKEFHTPLDWKK